jgi:hypothetical protein
MRVENNYYYYVYIINPFREEIISCLKVLKSFQVLFQIKRISLIALEAFVYQNLKENKTNAFLCYSSRYAPMMNPAVRTFYVSGIHLSEDHPNICNQENCIIHLDQLSKNTSASYRCEVSGDAPEFKIAHETANMTVAGKFLF